jgi:hypothetical protein
LEDWFCSRPSQSPRHRLEASLAELLGEAGLRSWDLAPAAPSPGSAATAAPPAATAPASTPSAASAGSTGSAATTSATAYNNDGQLHVTVVNVFPVEEMEGGETDVGHFLFAKNEALIGRSIVRLRGIGSGNRGSGCATHQRKTQSSGTQHRQSSSCVFLFRSLLDPWHGRILQYFLRRNGKRAPGESGAQLPGIETANI